ncbi:hypothetical protein AB0G02_19950 [Actinosynnema sp. NPDC023658]|uniref:hypothetical protein n=1 Tax=Actinosynnema sp. NPDC023658 TaxID=3155465 RepID=UPI0033D93E81
MKSIRTAAVALALGVGFAVSSGAAVAAPATTSGEIGIQCTRQYVVTGNSTLRNSPGGAVIAYSITGDKFNVPSPSGVWYEGNLYDQYNTYLGHGFMLASALAYTGTCF